MVENQHGILKAEGRLSDLEDEADREKGLRSFVAELTLMGGGRRVTGRAQGSNKKTAAASAALSVVRQLYHAKVLQVDSRKTQSMTKSSPRAHVQAYAGPQPKKDPTALPEFPLSMDPALVDDVRSYLEEVSGNKIEKVHLKVNS